jgi:hypothetical protein
MKLQVFNGETHQSVVKTSASGSTLCTYMSRKDYGVANNLKGAALKRQHEQYRLDRGIQANSNVASMLAGGKIVIEKCRMNKTGSAGSFNFTMAEQFESATEKQAVASALVEHNAKVKAQLIAFGIGEADAEAIISGKADGEVAAK